MEDNIATVRKLMQMVVRGTANGPDSMEARTAAVQAVVLIDKHNLLRDEPFDEKIQGLDEDIKRTLIKIKDLIADPTRFSMDKYTMLHLSALLAVSMQIREIVRGGFSRLTTLIERRSPP